jgi:single-strand DNA-binding protein
MASFNRVILLGNLTRDPELRYIPSGTAVTEIGLAVNDRRKAANGEWVDETTFVDVTLWGRTAEIATEYLSKGSPVLIEGRLKLDSWQDKDGQKRSKLRVIGERMQMVGAKGQGGGGGGGTGGRSAPRSGGGAPNYDESEYGPPADTYAGPSGPGPGMPADDDIPF